MWTLLAVMAPVSLCIGGTTLAITSEWRFGIGFAGWSDRRDAATPAAAA